jgi:hypothetical protein
VLHLLLNNGLAFTAFRTFCQDRCMAQHLVHTTCRQGAPRCSWSAELSVGSDCRVTSPPSSASASCRSCTPTMSPTWPSEGHWISRASLTWRLSGSGE